MLESRHSYDFKQDTKRSYATQSVDKGRFLNWTNENMFRTSYGDSFCNKVADGDADAASGQKQVHCGLRRLHPEGQGRESGREE